MSNFPSDGEISIDSARAFIESKFADKSPNTINKIFQTLEEKQFILNNGDFDEPHKLSEIYGVQNPVELDGLSPGDHEFKVEIARNHNKLETANDSSDFPFCVVTPNSFMGSTFGDFYMPVDVESSHKINTSNIPILPKYNSEDEEWSVSDWVLAGDMQTSSVSTSVVEELVLDILNSKRLYHQPIVEYNGGLNAGLYVEIDVTEGELYYFEALTNFVIKLYEEGKLSNTNIVVANHPWNSSEFDWNSVYLDTRETDFLGYGFDFDFLPYATFTPNQSSIFISVFARNPEYSFGLGEMNLYKLYEHGENRYAELKVNLYNMKDNEKEVIIPRVDPYRLGLNPEDPYFSNSVKADNILSIDAQGVARATINDLNIDTRQMRFFDSNPNQSNTSNQDTHTYFDINEAIESDKVGYVNMYTKRILLKTELAAEIVNDDGSDSDYRFFSKQIKYKNEAQVLLNRDESLYGFGYGVVNVVFEKSHNYWVRQSENGNWVIADKNNQEITGGTTWSDQQNAIDHWNQNYVNQAEYYLSQTSNQIFDWSHVLFDRTALPLVISIASEQFLSIYRHFFLDVSNRFLNPKELTGTVTFFEGFRRIVGDDTRFSFEVGNGDIIKIGNDFYLVDEVRNNLNLYVKDAPTYTHSGEGLPVEVMHKVSRSYPRGSVVPQAGYASSNLRIHPYYLFEVNQDLKNTISLAIQKLESVVKNSIDFNIFFMPMDEIEAGGVLASAYPDFRSPFSGSKSGLTAKFLKDSNPQTIDTVQNISTDSFANFSVAKYKEVFSLSLTSGYEGGGYHEIKLKDIRIKNCDVLIEITNSSGQAYARKMLGELFDQTYDCSFIFQAQPGLNRIYFYVADFEQPKNKISFKSGESIALVDTKQVDFGSLVVKNGEKIMIGGKIVNVEKVYLDALELSETMDYDAIDDDYYVVETPPRESYFFCRNVELILLDSRYARDSIISGNINIDPIDASLDSSNIIIYEDKTPLYNVLLHEFIHAIGLASQLWHFFDLKKIGSDAPTQHVGYYATKEYKDLVKEKIDQLNLPVTIDDFYTQSVPAQGGGAHNAEYAKIVNYLGIDIIQPSFPNELMSPFYDFSRAIFSRLTLGHLEDIGYEVDYTKAESSYLLTMSQDTTSWYGYGSDALIKQRVCCNGSHHEKYAAKNPILPDRTSE